MNNTEIGINQLKRRDFLRAGLVFGAGAAGLAAGYAAVPDAFARAVYAAKQNGIANDNVLVMSQLAGGNDGLRTLVPLTDPTLHDLRPKLAGPMVSQALPLTTDFGLNHNLGGIKSLWDKGKVAIVQGVGYPNPTFSHFESIRIWETGDPTRRQVDGWLGRTLAKAYDSNGHPLTGCACGATDVPGALRDLQATMTVIQNQKTFGFTGGSEVEAAVGALYKGTPGIYGALFDTAIATANDTIATLRTSSTNYQPMADYSDKVQLVYSSKNQLAAALQLAAELIVTGTGVKLLHVTLGGFDTHYTELNRHDDLMGYLDSAVSAFYQDLAAHGKADKVLIATWSEFGRRPKENASGGTDHGAAAPLLLIGDPVKSGLYGAEPSLTSLDSTGNLKFAVDFRSVYQEILGGHLAAGTPRRALKPASGGPSLPRHASTDALLVAPPLPWLRPPVPRICCGPPVPDTDAHVHVEARGDRAHPGHDPGVGSVRDRAFEEFLRAAAAIGGRDAAGFRRRRPHGHAGRQAGGRPAGDVDVCVLDPPSRPTISRLSGRAAACSGWASPRRSC